MPQQTPVQPPSPQRPKIVRTPYGWDCKMEDEASVIPPWKEPEASAGRRGLMTWALVPLAIAVVAVVAWHPPGIPFRGGGTSRPPATASAKPTDAPSPTPRPTPSPSPSAAPTPTPDPAPSPTATPPPAPPPAAAAKQVTGVFGAGVAGTTCNGGQAGTASIQCDWGVTALQGSAVQFALTWPEGTPLRLTVWAPNNQNLYTGTGVGAITTTIPNMPPKTVVIVSPMNAGPAPATFALAITMQAP